MATPPLVLHADDGHADRLLEGLRLHVERMPLAFVALGPDLRVSDWNPAAESVFGFRRDEVLGRDPLGLMVPPAARPAVEAVFRQVRDGDPEAHSVNENVTKDGRVITCEWFNTRLTEPGGRFAGLVSMARDVTERLRAEDARHREREFLRAVLGSIEEAVFACDAQGTLTYANRPAQAILGEARPPVPLEEWTRLYRVLHTDLKTPMGPEDLPLLRALRGEAVRDVELVLDLGRGESQFLLASGQPLLDAEGNRLGAVVAVRDVTERRRLQEQHTQAQKMEAVGRLAGGVAHDFNNALTVITGYGHAVLGDLPADSPVRTHVAEMVKAGERAAELVRRLLAFSRKSVLAPRVLDLNEVVRGLEGMLRRLLGEDIDLVTSLRPCLGRVRADPGQLEQALINLAANARDAMPRGGRLTVETADLPAGEGRGPQVLLAVTDTGCGMTAEVRARAFEPFFTTKEKGRGTGLGLAMVHGFVRQSGGHVEAHSEPGHGTTFRLYLPRVQEEVAGRTPHPGPPAAPRGTETVLLVEDEEGVRALVRQVLRAGGYTVLEAGDGARALRVAEMHLRPIHLLLTDVVMPEMGGRELAERLLALHPAARVLFTSGYTDDALVRHGVLEDEVAFLHKPFTPADLARKVREVLDSPGTA
jgi:PAS domain S-box-containing protein